MTSQEPAAPRARTLRGARDSAPPVPAGGALVLVVDGDAVTRRFVELALASEKRLHVETVATAAAAIELMRTTPCDLVITEARLPDLDGLDLVRRLRSRGHGHELAIVVLTGDERMERKVAAFAAGVDDYLAKPCPLDELRARVVRRLLHRFAERAERMSKVALLAGQFAAMPLPDLVGVLAMGRKTATLQLYTPRGRGALYFDDGRIVHALFLGVTGARAFYHLFAEDQGSFHLYDGCDALEHTIHESVTGLIMEAARVLDTARAAGTATIAAVPPGERPVALPTSLHRLTPDRDLALGFMRDITDSYNLATLELLSTAELSTWSRRAALGPRLQVVVVAPAIIGAAALASIATAPGERELAAAISGDVRCLVATLRGRDTRELDLIVVPLGAGDLLMSALGRRPDHLVLAGPEGDLLTSMRHYTDALARLGAAVVVAVGDPRFGAAIATELGTMAATTLCHRDADLGQPGELRRALSEALRLWLSGAR